MNATERKMLDTLTRLKEVYGILAVKAEFEAEGSRTDELVMLNEVTFRAGMNLIIKIGGCEAVRDLDQCRLLGASGIMAPMIETPFAMKKFVNASRKVYADQAADVEWIINTETVTCHQNLEAILTEGKGFLSSIVIGRVDYAASLGLGRDEVNGDAISERSIDMAKRAREYGCQVGVGGGVSMDAIPSLQKMCPYIDRFETRKIVFPASADEGFLRNGIMYAMEFETLYLRNKREYYDRMAKEDLSRINMMEARLRKAESCGGDLPPEQEPAVGGAWQ